MLAVGQESRIAVAAFLRRRDLRRYISLASRNTNDRPARDRRKEDHTVFVPCTGAVRQAGGRECLLRSSVHIDSFQKRICEESNRAIVGRPKRKRPACSSR